GAAVAGSDGVVCGVVASPVTMALIRWRTAAALVGSLLGCGGASTFAPAARALVPAAAAEDAACSTPGAGVGAYRPKARDDDSPSGGNGLYRVQACGAAREYTCARSRGPGRLTNVRNGEHSVDLRRAYPSIPYFKEPYLLCYPGLDADGVPVSLKQE